jgi:uncharacterized protein (TIGR02145 family)
MKALVCIFLTYIVFLSCSPDPVSLNKNQPPKASFHISPSIGGIETLFLFDASTSYDNEDDSSSLYVRWDWENDGKWDTNYSTKKIYQHQYSTVGIKNIILEVKDSEGLIDTTMNTISLSTVLKAIFSVTPLIGNTSTIFEFDASNSSDNVDGIASLEIRWDWENDGVWDTNYSTEKIISHQYSSNGIKTIILEVRNSFGLTDTSSVSINLSTPPIAIASSIPDSGDTDTVFEFDASSSTDNEEDISSLQVRWDWENDGVWDTDYSTKKIATHRYLDMGSYIVKMQVKDNANMTDSTLIGPILVGITDIDGNIYKTVKIGEQWWMAENLKVTHYRNGDAITNITDNSEWVNLNSGAYCAYANDPVNVSTYGLLYNGYAVIDNRNIAPEGWHVPTEQEWIELEKHLGMNDSEIQTYFWRGTDQGTKLKERGTEHWNDPNSGATNETGFLALPGGGRFYMEGSFSYLGRQGCWWSSTEKSSTYAWSRRLGYDKLNIYRDYDFKKHGFSVRCIKD